MSFRIFFHVVIQKLFHQIGRLFAEGLLELVGKQRHLFLHGGAYHAVDGVGDVRAQAFDQTLAQVLLGNAEHFPAVDDLRV